jgi:hypothetical protein
MDRMLMMMMRQEGEDPSSLIPYRGASSLITHSLAQASCRTTLCLMQGQQRDNYREIIRRISE